MEANKQLTVKGLFEDVSIKERFEKMLGTKAQGFITSVIQIVNSNDLLKKAEPMSVYTAAATAATLDLPLNNNLGLAYIVPYKTSGTDGEGKQKDIYLAQFQMGYKGFKQLAHRSKQFLFLHATDVRKGEMKAHERLSGKMEFDWILDENERNKLEIVGYVSYFKLINGFEETFYMTVEDLEKHAIRYSQSYKKYKSGLWKDDKPNMCLKTVTKLNISKNAPLSIESLQIAIEADQGVISNDEFTPVTYIDNQKPSIEEKKEAIKANGEKPKEQMP